MTMKFSLLALPLSLLLVPSLGMEQSFFQWRNLQIVKDKKQRRKLSGGVRGEKKEEDEEYEKKSKKKLAKKDKCNRDRKSVTIHTLFDSDDLNPLSVASTEGVLFSFTGDYSGNWTQTSIEITDDIILGHDHLVFFDSSGEIAGAITTQFDATVNFAIVTGGYGEFACAEGSPLLEMYEDSTMVDVTWDLCVCY